MSTHGLLFWVLLKKIGGYIFLKVRIAKVARIVSIIRAAVLAIVVRITKH